ncbi:MAG: hypothetical protein K0M70_13280 [Arenimonas sp.]|uniref:hypothetical protein n=1 Tax=Arenimonas sp. TaxID=1872635 RepID=UPI0025BCA2E1|nr:hypothetical protein [Arenimonas sp.]MBW8368818.1 hypothetical protein [Arenimonas sp.]
MNFGKLTALVCAATLTTACATGSKEIKASYVSPMTYDAYSCQQLIQETQRLQGRISSVAGDVDQKASGDRVKMGVGLVLFWPTLFFLKGDGPEAQEYARLKGEHQALEDTYTRKNCANLMADQNGASRASAGQVGQPMAPATEAAGGSLLATTDSAVGHQFASPARKELIRMQCSADLGLVSDERGEAIFEGRCNDGKRQLVACRGMACKALN